MPDLFHNPYHFVPIPAGEPPECVPLAEFAVDQPKDRRATHVTHDRFVDGTHSGRIVCKVTVETPLICGNEHDERANWTKLIKPFELNKNEPALPASALRGMISSLAEAASHSAFRILADTALSHRMAAREESLSAIGLLIDHNLPDENHILKLQPLTVPTLDTSQKMRVPELYREMFQPSFGQPFLKAYVDGYQRKRDAMGKFAVPPELKVSSLSFLADQAPNSHA